MQKPKETAVEFKEVNSGRDQAPMEMMSEFLSLVTVENLTEQSARKALSISSAILRIEPTNNLIRQYQKTLNDFIEHTKNDDDIQDEDDESSGEEEEEEEEEEDESDGEYESKR